MQTKIAVVGDRGSILGFKAVGFDGFEVEGKENIERLAARLVREDYGIIFITEELAAVNQAVMDKYKDDMLPAIIPIPGRKGSLGIGIDSIHRNVERAVGTDIFNDK